MSMKTLIKVGSTWAEFWRRSIATMRQ